MTSGKYHEVYVNGQLLARGPGLSFDFAKYYDEIDILPYLRLGSENLISILSLDDSPQRGVLAEIIMEADSGVSTTVATDATWKTRCHESFKSGMPPAIPLGREEVYDSRLECPGWTCLEYNDSEWDNAVSLGPIGTPPWTGLEPAGISLLTDDPVFPKRFTAIELCELRKGYSFRLGAPGECVNIFLTEIICSESAKLTIWNEWGKASAEWQMSLDGSRRGIGEPFELAAGSHLLCYSVVGQLELMIETDARLTFTARNLLPDSSTEWVVLSLMSQTVRYPWHFSGAQVMKSTPEVATLLQVSTTAGIPSELREQLVAAPKAEISAQHHVRHQIFYRPSGGFTEPAIEKAQPRVILDGDGLSPMLHPENMLHGHADFSIITPQADKDVHFILDFGRMQIGHIEFSLNAPTGTIVDIQCFEMIDDGGIYLMEIRNGFRYICREGWQEFISHARRGFRYASVTIRNFARPVSVRQISCRSSRYPVQHSGGFECNDSLLNRVFQMSADTAELCMLDTYVDCPGHEQHYWVGDAQITALINLLHFGAYRLNQRCIRLVGRSLSEEWTRTYYPDDARYTGRKSMPMAAFPNYPEGGLPMWTFQWIRQCWEHFLHEGNREDLTENYNYVEETLRHCRLLTNERGLFDMPGAWNLIEWGKNDLSPYGEVTANNVLLVQCCRHAAHMAETLGDLVKSRAFSNEATERAQAINTICWDAQRQAYVDTVRDEWAFEQYREWCVVAGESAMGWKDYHSCLRISEQSNTLALLFDCVPEERRNSVARLVRRVGDGHYIFGSPSMRSIGAPGEDEAPGGVVAVGSPFFLFFSLGALFKLGDVETALNVMRRDWGDMLDKGTNTCWETFRLNDIRWTRSICHAWGAAPAVYLMTDVLGVRPLTPGYRRFAVEPQLGGLKWARGTVNTPFGPIFVDCRARSGGDVEVNCSAPIGCERENKPNTISVS